MAKIVTSCYANHVGDPYWGQMSRDLWYPASLRSICGFGCPVVCYTDAGDRGYDQLTAFKEKNNLSNLTIKVYVLEDSPWFNRVLSIRRSDPEEYNDPDKLHRYHRSSVIYWSKFVFLHKEADMGQNVFWIDCGLSHSGLFPGSMRSYDLEGVQNSYHYDLAFTPNTLKKIEDRVQGKIVVLCRSSTDADILGLKKELGDFHAEAYPVGGFFGGSFDYLMKYITEAYALIHRLLLTDYLCNDEEISTYIVNKFPQWFSIWMFDTFYHEDWKDAYDPNQISFSNFFR